MTTTTPIGPSIQLPWTQRVNIRLWIVLGMLALLVGFPLYQGLELLFTGGIKSSSDGKGAILKVDLKSMSSFEMDPALAESADIPARWREIDGKRVALQGEIWLSAQAADEIGRFDLVYSIARCCLQGKPKIQHFVHCRTAPGKLVRYYNNQVIAKGILHVGIERDKETGKILSVYRLDVESVEPF